MSNNSPKIKSLDLPEVVMSEKMTAKLSMASARNKKRTKSIRLKKRDKPTLKKEWEELPQDLKLVLILLSEHRTMTRQQIQRLFLIGYKRDTLAFGGWLNYLSVKYKTDLDPSQLFTIMTERSIYYKTLSKLRHAGLVDVVNYILQAKTMVEHPVVNSSLYFLTEHGAQIVCAGGEISLQEVGFVPNYERFSAASATHDLNVNEFFLNTIFSIQHLIDLKDPRVGIIDFAKWKSERECVHQLALDGSKYFFRPDGLAIIYSSARGGFLPIYLEFDTGSSSAHKIQHKTKAYIRYMTTMFREQKLGTPVMLFVSVGNREKFYQKNIAKALKDGYGPMCQELNEYARILTTTTKKINTHTPMGKIWKVIDLSTGKYLEEPIRLLEIQ